MDNPNLLRPNIPRATVKKLNSELTGPKPDPHHTVCFQVRNAQFYRILSVALDSNTFSPKISDFESIARLIFSQYIFFYSRVFQRGMM